MFLDEEPLVLALQIDAPADRIFEFHSVGHGLFEYAYSLGVRKSYELGVRNAAESLDKTVVIFVVEEAYVVQTVLESIVHQILDKLLGQVHVVLYVIEGHFRLNHPEFRKVARGVRVLCPEGRAEGVYLAEGRSSELAFELTAHRQGGLFSEEIPAVIYLALLVSWKIVQI